jgi:bacteriophage N4 adsorption protein B
MLLTFAIVTVFFVMVFSLDDMFIDLVAWTNNLHPNELTDDLLQKWRAMPEKNIAIMVANWHEAEVIGKMVAGNNRRVEYKNFHFFIGVYPNDLETVAAAQNASAAFQNVHVIINSKDGPTSKGQMLNEIARSIFRREEELGFQFDVFLMHDSEDILHPLSLKLINSEISRAEFLQIPVFSFERKLKDWVGSTYIDEFSEIHTKDMFVRQHLGAPLPSAGVGTSIQRKLMLALILGGDSCFLREESLTEDYVLGMSAALRGFRTAFACYYRNTEKGRDFIATREYFPNGFQAAIRQKTRWILGIVLQGSKIVPWTGSWIHKYFLYRDRRGPLNNAVALATTALFAMMIGHWLIYGVTPDFMSEAWFRVGSTIATLGLVNRLFHRMRAVYMVNGPKRIWLVPLRWPLGNIINFVASYRAIRQYHRAVVKKEPLKWAKTTHELPEDFGNELPEITQSIISSGSSHEHGHAPSPERLLPAGRKKDSSAATGGIEPSA